MKMFKKTLIISTVSAMVLSGVLLTNTSMASQATKSLEVVYNNIKIKYNNKDVSIDPSLEPFLVNGNTFIPLRAVGDVFGKKITWDGDTYTVSVADGDTAVNQATVDDLNNKIKSLTTDLAAANAKVTEKDKQIASLQSQIAALQDDLDEVDLDDLESDLNDDYEDYEDLNADISLSGDEDDITVTVKVDPDTWDDLTSSKHESFLQDIVDDIRDEASDADIEGTVKSEDDSSKLLTFTVDSSDDVDIEDTAASLDDLEDELNDDYGDYEDVDLNVELSGDEDDITVKVYITQDDWESLTSSQQNKLQDDLIEDIENEFEDADVNGYVYDSDDDSRLDTF